MNTENEITYEKAFARLEQILEKLSSSNAALDESLTLYEEADHLLRFCNKRLDSAEKKIEVLLKNREGAPEKAPFEPPRTASLQSTDG